MLYAFFVFVCTVATVYSVVALYLVTRSSRRRLFSGKEVLPVTVLKPLCGADDELESNLETFFHQDYPDYELLFGVEGNSDPAIGVVRLLKQRYPNVRCSLVIHDGRCGLNPKISNLRSMIATRTHDVVVISDSNIAVAPEYLSEMVGQLQDKNVGLVTNLFCGVGERTLGATLENLHLNGPVAGSIAGSQLNGHTVAVGKSMMFRRSVL
ncbi:MAG: glycosyltransferase, partial [Pseudomonadota bacterium]